MSIGAEPRRAARRPRLPLPAGNPRAFRPTWELAIWRGDPYPLGATWDGQGVNFALYSEDAEKVELCLFDVKGKQEMQRLPIRWKTDQVWHCYLPEARPGLLYGYRVYGPYDPQNGFRFNHHKLLLDPYAKEFVGTVRWNDALFGYHVGSPKTDLSFDRRDSAAYMPKSKVLYSAFPWGEDRPLRIPWDETIIYEMHVKGFSMMNPAVPRRIRGTYAGVASEASIRHLKRLGITAVELMPVHFYVDDRRLVEQSLVNYWGYNTIGFFAPDPRYSATGDITEFKSMVKRLHSAGIEVILDVVYNHTAEGNHMGPTLSFRGIDNPVYYRLVDDDRRYYMDYTGTGNTLNMHYPRTIQLLMDSLRYWVVEMHVDGFRFDLASALARELHEVDRLSTFFEVIHQDPILSQVKLIAEPWDIGQGGYQVGNFPVGWAEWNGRYRDTFRAYWKGDGGLIGEVAYRLTGSSDLYESGGRRPYASVNFLTCHDGFTLRDLVSYNEKHNEANGEENRDGSDHNLSWNCGAEGPTDDPAIGELRLRQQRNMIATLMLSLGVPMISSGDEIGRTQNGNNNTYCQDNEISWLDWRPDDEMRKLLRFFRRVIRLRRKHPTFRRHSFYQGKRLKGAGVKDIVWLSPEGREMSDEEWTSSSTRTMGVFLAIDEEDAQGGRIRDDDFIIIMNAHHEPVQFVLPAFRHGDVWRSVLDTGHADGMRQALRLKGGEAYQIGARSLALLCRRRDDARRPPAAR